MFFFFCSATVSYFCTRLFAYLNMLCERTIVYFLHYITIWCCDIRDNYDNTSGKWFNSLCILSIEYLSLIINNKNYLLGISNSSIMYNVSTSYSSVRRTWRYNCIWIHILKNILQQSFTCYQETSSRKYQY